MRILLLLPMLTFAPLGRSAPPSAPPGGEPPSARPEAPPVGFHHVRLNGHTFTLPEGFTIELAAGPPHVDRPVVAAFDERGRLYVCDSSGSNEKVTEQLKKKPHRIVRLEDTNGDGTYDRSTVYVSNVMFPEGAMWLNGSLYVAAPPQILKFTDTNDDGKADKEEVWFDGKTLTGCANDLHGPYLGPDGWVYWCKGAFAKQEYKLPNGKAFSSRASHVFRAKPDGSNVEPVMTGGMDNPVDVVFTPGGERIFSTTFFQHPADGKRDGLIHAVYGGIYGKDHDPIYEHPWTSPHLMPVLTHMGPAAPCGLHRYESGQFGKDYENNVFCCQFNMRKVSRHVLVPSGSTFTSKDSDFVVSDHRDFHPTDVIEDADGSLLVLDTGGWYKLCCPTSQLVKPDVTGAIYRVKKVGAHKVDDPRGLKVDWANAAPKELARLLDDPRPVVQQKAIDAISRRKEAGNALLNVVASNGWSIRAKRNAIWTSARLVDKDRIEILSVGLVNPDETARAIAVHVCALRRDLPIHLVENLKSSSPLIRRVTAEALGRTGDPKVVPALLEALASEQNDRALDHSLAYALIEIANPGATAEGLKAPSPRVRRAALVALDQMPEGKLDPKAVLAELDAKDAGVKETAWWIAGRHPQWGGQLAGYFREQLKQVEKLTPAERDELTDRLAKFAKNEEVQTLIGDALANTPAAAAERLLLRAMARSGLKALPGSWGQGLQRAVAAENADSHRDAIAVLRAVQAPKSFYDVLVKTKASGRSGKDGPMDVLATAPPGWLKLDATRIESYARLIHRDQPPEVRAAATEAMVRAAIAPDGLISLAAALKTANSFDLVKLLPVFSKSADEKLGLALVTALSDPAVRATVRAEQVKPILDKYPKAVRAEADKLYALLAEARKDEQAKLERLVKQLPTGDIRRGQAVFNGAKVQCAACHKIGYVGGLVGPDLTRVGGIRTERDLLEAIVFPSASFVRSYEPMRVTTADGRALNGILKKDAPDEIVLVAAADKEERIARADIETISPSTVSVMPAGLDQQLSLQELADVVAFLKACK